MLLEITLWWWTIEIQDEITLRFREAIAWSPLQDERLYGFPDDDDDDVDNGDDYGPDDDDDIDDDGDDGGDYKMRPLLKESIHL